MIEGRNITVLEASLLELLAIRCAGVNLGDSRCHWLAFQVIGPSNFEFLKTSLKISMARLHYAHQDSDTAAKRRCIQYALYFHLAKQRPLGA